MSDKDGGPAFPVSDGCSHYRDRGLTVRDYFAAAAVQGILHYFPSVSHEITSDDDARKKRIATDAYRIADAMLTARSK